MSNADAPVVRCGWAGTVDANLIAYHDEEWGVPQRDDRALFELLTLEGAQAGLSWTTILNRRDGYRRAFAGFDIERIGAFDDADVERLLADTGIIRNRAKVRATIANARATLELKSGGRPLSDHVWSFVGGAPIVNRWRRIGDLPAATEESTAMSRDLRRRGFGFVGPTICYAFMQAAGLVNDHQLDCFRWTQVQERSAGR